MTTPLNTPRIGIGLLIAVAHLALLYAFLASRPVPPPEAAQAERPAIQWLLATPRARPAPAPSATLLALPPPRRKTPPAIAPSSVATAAPVPAAPPVQAPAEADAPPAAAPARPSIDEIMRIAKRDIGKIDQQLRKDFPQRSIQAPLDTPQARLERGFAAAHAAVPPTWYEAAKMEELTPLDTSGSRIYKISTALLTYCVTISPTGERRYTNCPR
ncbi:hypothetical protein [Janthinobacterium sp.]|uniref:hypothetical protein n=1 Tax=Janthinobacterium sp. TaxID=1871054 RepID=UPI00293D8AAC|nr:hypothetical protein [Janthinobacterium sp.]